MKWLSYLLIPMMIAPSLVSIRHHAVIMLTVCPVDAVNPFTGLIHTRHVSIDELLPLFDDAEPVIESQPGMNDSDGSNDDTDDAVTG